MDNLSILELIPSQEENINEHHCFCTHCLQPLGFSSDDDSEALSDSSSDDEESISPVFREDPADIEERILEEIDDYVSNNPLRISRPNIESEIAAEINTLLFEEWLEEELCDEEDLPEIREWIQKTVTMYFECATSIPPRQGGFAAAITPSIYRPKNAFPIHHSNATATHRRMVRHPLQSNHRQQFMESARHRGSTESIDCGEMPIIRPIQRRLCETDVGVDKQRQSNGMGSEIRARNGAHLSAQKPDNYRRIWLHNPPGMAVYRRQS